MAKTRRRLSVLILLTCLVFALFPRMVLGEAADGWDTWYEDEEAADAEYEEEYVEYEDDSWYEDEYVEYEDDSWYEDESAYEESSYPIMGVDVSEWNGEVDWESAVEGGVGFAILRCGVSHGPDKTCYIDESFVRNALECERLGIPYGVYFFSGAESEWDAYNEAWTVVSLLQDEGLYPTLPVFIDLELESLANYESVPTLTAISEAFCTTVAEAGYQPGVYASLSWWDYLLTDPCFDQWSRWVAQYNDWCDYQGSYQFWQCSYAGELPGFSTYVDLNYWYV
jgi:GH25 family lysozyme M1 (1,4-beta-N-acetylmuramidase)